jgi:diacylglycerol O-acyltransferase
MSRLSFVDSSFLRVESESAHMHVGWFSIVELPRDADRLDVDALSRQIAGRLHLTPRFRQRVTEVPLGTGEPVWSDDPAFDLANHVRDLPPTFAQLALRRATDAFFARPLRRDRPLWEIGVIPRLTDGRAALLGKIHHAMVDGVAAVELGMLLFDASPDAIPSEPESWSPAASEPPAKLALDAARDTALDQFRATRKMVGLARSPAQTVRIAQTLRRAAMSLAEDALRPAPASYLNVDIGPARTVVTHRIDLGRLLRLKESRGVKLNDVVLATCAGALRRFALDRGEPPVDLRVMVPINTRKEGGDGPDAGNKITFGFIELPISSDRAQERLDRVVEAMTALKSGGFIDGSSTLLESAGMLPAPIKSRAARAAASSRLFNLIISNVPGPRMPLYACGARVRSIHPIIPIPDRHALSIGVLTYDHGAHFCCYADPHALPRAEGLAIALEDAVIELEGTARWGARGAPRPHSSHVSQRRGSVGHRHVHTALETT